MKDLQGKVILHRDLNVIMASWSWTEQLTSLCVNWNANRQDGNYESLDPSFMYKSSRILKANTLYIDFDWSFLTQHAWVQWKEIVFKTQPFKKDTFYLARFPGITRKEGCWLLFFLNLKKSLNLFYIYLWLFVEDGMRSEIWQFYCLTLFVAFGTFRLVK